jgi:hypothetical protein
VETGCRGGQGSPGAVAPKKKKIWRISTKANTREGEEEGAESEKLITSKNKWP